MLPQFFFVDFNSPCKYLRFPRGPNLVQKPFYLVGSVLKPLKLQSASAIKFNTKEVSEDSLETTTPAIVILLNVTMCLLDLPSAEMKNVYEMTDTCQSNTLTWQKP